MPTIQAIVAAAGTAAALDPNAETLLAGVELAPATPSTWSGTLACGAAVSVFTATPGHFVVQTPVGSARVTLPTRAADDAGDSRSRLAAIASLYAAGDEAALAEAEARHLLATHDWYFTYSDSIEVYRRGCDHRAAMMEALRRLPYETARALYDAHAPQGFFPYSEEAHQSAA